MQTGIVLFGEKLEVKIKTLLEDLNERYTRELSDIYEAFDFLLITKRTS